MPRIESFSPPTKAQHPDIEEKYWRLIDALVKQTQVLTEAMQGDISFADNFNAVERVVEMRDSVFVDISAEEVRGIPEEVSFISSDFLGADNQPVTPRFDFSVPGENKVSVRAVWPAPAPSGVVNVKIRIRGPSS